MTKRKEAKPAIGERAACQRCGQEVEWNGDAWWDRGADTKCGPDYVTPHDVRRSD